MINEELRKRHEKKDTLTGTVEDAFEYTSDRHIRFTAFRLKVVRNTTEVIHYIVETPSTLPKIGFAPGDEVCVYGRISNISFHAEATENLTTGWFYE